MSVVSDYSGNISIFELISHEFKQKWMLEISIDVLNIFSLSSNNILRSFFIPSASVLHLKTDEIVVEYFVRFRLGVAACAVEYIAVTESRVHRCRSDPL